MVYIGADHNCEKATLLRLVVSWFLLLILLGSTSQLLAHFFFSLLQTLGQLFARAGALSEQHNHRKISGLEPWFLNINGPETR